MFTPSFYLGLALLLAGIVVSRILTERALKLLTNEEKLVLLDSFSGMRKYGSLPLVLVAFSFFGLGSLPLNLFWPAYSLLWVALAASFAIPHRLVSRRLQQLNINPEYRSAFARARYVLYAGFLGFFLCNTIPVVFFTH